MSNYYFLGTLLPELSIDEPPKITFKELNHLLKDNLSENDYKQIRRVRHFYDILNLRYYWKNEPLNPLGNFDFSTLEEAFATRSILPKYVFEFMDKHPSKEGWITHFPDLLATYFIVEIKESEGIFKEYLSLERDLRLVGAAFRTKKLKGNVMKELQYENPEEDLITQILAQKDAPSYLPPEKYSDLKEIFDTYGNNPLELEKSLILYRFKKIDEWLGLELFSIDRIVGYLLKFIMVISWRQMNKQKGLEIVDRMLKEST